MTTNPDFEGLNKQCERSITKMSDAEELAHIGQLIDDAFDAWRQTRALFARRIVEP